MEEKKLQAGQADDVTWVSYAALIFAILFFSGIFASSQGWLKVLDFTVLNGSYGKIALDGAKTAFTFRGAGGTGARDGFMFALELMPAVILALGVVSVVEGLGGLRAAQKLMTPLLKPVIGIPGICGLALIASLQSTDAGAGMTKELYQNGQITDDERTVFSMFQISADAPITNYFSSAAALFSIMLTPIIVPFVVMMVFKVLGANLLRIYIKATQKKTAAGMPQAAK